MARLFFTLLFLAAGNLYAQDVRISEFLAANVNGLRDEDGDPSGWIELYNPSPAAKVILTGWRLSNGATEWTFPAFEIMPAEHIIVWASGKNRTVSTAPLHTSFTLPPEGSYLALIRAAGTVASEYAPTYPAQQPDVSYGRDAANPTLTGFYTDPTPNQENNYSGTGVAGKVAFSVGSKAYTGTLSVSLDQVPPDAQAVIRYTTNGSVPQAAGTTTFDYTGPITVSTTQVIRARVFKPGLLPGETESASYLLLNGTTMNFSSAMPMVVISNFGGGTPPETGDQAGYMWVFEKGADGRSRLSDPPAIATRIAMDRRGSSTIGNPKFNLNVEARKARDDYDRNIPLLGMPAESDWVFHAPYSFDPALVRNPFPFALSNSIKRYAPRNRMAEVFIDTNASDLNFGGTGATNNYFGIYNVLEKIRRGPERVKVTPLNTYDNGPVEKTGGYIVKVDRKDSGDVGFITPREGPGRWPLANGFAYYEPKEIELRSPQRDPQEQYIGVAATGSPVPLIGFLTDLDNAAFAANYRDPVLGFRRYLDEDAAIDHHLLNVWPMNVDAMRLSGYMSKERGGKIVYGPIWDYDRSMDSTDGRDDNPATWRGQGGDQGTDFFNYTWWSRMFTDPDFYQRYIDRWVELRRNEFSQASVNALLDALNAEMSAEGISRDLARWNQAKRPFQGMTGQAAEIARIKDWLQRRVVFMENQWVKPVAITPAAGNVAPGTVVTMTAATVGSTIYYTTDGSDPRPPGGTAPTTALPYSAPITVNATMRIRARAYHPTFTALTGANNPPIVSRWSGRTDARYSTDAPAGAGNLVVTELNYHPSPPTTAELEVNPVFAEGGFEFIEVKNIGTAPIDLGGARFTAGIDFTFAGENAFTLDPGAHAIIAANPAGFAARYGARPNVVGGFVGDLDNGGERLLLVDVSGATILDFTYDDLWHGSTDGDGQTLVIYDQGAPEPAFSTLNNWRPSSAAGGSPGGDEPPFVVTLEATAVTATSAQLNAEVSPNGTATSLDFVVGADRIATPGVPATNSATVIGQDLTGLAPHTLYSYRAEAANPLGVRAGTEVLFTTLNRVPTPVADEMHILQRDPFAIDVLASDTDPDSDPLTIISVTQGAFGTVSTDGNSVLYAPGANYSGADSFSYTVSDGFGGETAAIVTLTNSPPVALGDLLTTNGEPVTFDPRSNDTDADNDPLAVSGTTQGAVGIVAVTAEGTISYTPGTQFFGRDTFTYTVTDGAATATETVSVRSSAAVSIVRASSGQQVPGAEPGTVYAKLGAPSNGSFLGMVEMSSGDREGAVFATDGTMRLKVGDPAPGVAGAFIKKLQEPSGQAVVAKLRGTGVNEKNDTVLYLGLYEATIRLGLREGELLPGGSTLKKVLSIDGNGSTVFVRCSLSGPLVDKSNDVALLALPPGSGVRLLAREGDVVLGRPITSLGTLVGSSGTLAEGRWRAGDDSIGVRLSFAGDAHALYSIPTNATSPAEWIEWGKTGDVYAGLGTAASFGLPGFAPDGASFLAQLALGSGAGVVKANDTSILRATAAGVDLLAAEGAAVPDGTGATLPGLTFKKFGDPIAGANSSTAFAATLAGAGVKENNRAGLWFAAEESLAMIARAGDLAPGGGRWEKFQSLVLPDGLGHGPIFTAKLVVKSSEGVTSATNRGIWGIDSEGTLRLLLRTGQVVSVNGASRTVSKFVALTPPDGSLGAAHGFDDQGATNVLVTFTDGTQAIIGIALP